MPSVTSWAKTHHLPQAAQQKWQEFVQQQWQPHTQAIEQRGQHHLATIQQAKTILRNLIIHNEDHATH
jgi:hypothetical protein